MGKIRPAIPTVNYATPRVFFEREMKYRTIWSVIACVMLGLLSVAFAVPVWKVHDPGLFAASFRVLFGLVSVAMMVGCIFFTWQIGVGRVDRIQITEDGIVRNRRLWPWAQIRSVHGRIYANGTMIQFYTDAGALRIPHQLQSTPAWTVDEYATIAGVLIEYVGPNYPQLKIDAAATHAD